MAKSSNYRRRNGEKFSRLLPDGTEEPDEGLTVEKWEAFVRERYPRPDRITRVADKDGFILLGQFNTEIAWWYPEGLWWIDRRMWI